MEYTVEIKSAVVSDGMLTVKVQFTSDDGTQIVHDSFLTRSGQDESWLKKKIADRIVELQGVNDLLAKIQVGEFAVETNPDAADASLSPKELYAADLETFNTMVSAMRKGVIDQDNESFQLLQQKLKADFCDDYLDLYK